MLTCRALNSNAREVYVKVRYGEMMFGRLSDWLELKRRPHLALFTTTISLVNLESIAKIRPGIKDTYDVIRVDI